MKRDFSRIGMVSTQGSVTATPPLGAGGVARQLTYVLELSRQLTHLGYGVDIWTSQVEGKPSDEIVDRGVRLLRVSSPARAFVSPEQMHSSLREWGTRVLARMRREGLAYTVLNSHYWDGGIVGQLLCEQLQMPHVHTPHSVGVCKLLQMGRSDADESAGFQTIRSFAQRCRYETSIYQDADLIVATSPHQGDLLRKYYGAEPESVRVIPPGYDDTRFFPIDKGARQVLRRRLGLEGQVILASRDIAEGNGYGIFVRAFVEVAARARGANLQLTIAGERLRSEDAPALERCRALVASLGLTSKVAFRECLTETDRADLYRAADVFVLSSPYQGFGIAGVEAMACGTPTVVTSGGSMFREFRFGVDVLCAGSPDPLDLAIAILKPLQYPAIAEGLSQEGAAAARKHSTWSVVAQRFVRALAAHADRKSGPLPRYRAREHE